ncbi:MAG: HAMP domain-containing sensor histidine kinase [Anaeromyxobacteraceae bacterium]
MAPPPTRELIARLTQGAFLDAARVLVPVLATPVVVLTVVVEVLTGAPLEPVLVQVGAFLLLSGGAFVFRGRPDVSAGCLVALLAAEGAISAAMFGPLAGNGALVLAASLLALAFYGAPRGVVASALAFGVYAGVGALMVAGVLPAPHPGGVDFSRALPWLRVAMTLAVAIASLGALQGILHRALARAMEQGAEERARALAAAREREEAFRALSSAQRVESMGYLAGGLAHDLRNTLTVVLSGAQALRGQPRHAAEILDDLERAARTGVQGAQRLLALARPPTSERCRPAEVIASLGRLLAPVLPPDVRLRVEAPATREVAIPEAALSQAVLNLAVNARDAMPAGGELSLRAHDDGGVGPIVVEVTDSGTGMDAGTLERAFEPLFTTKPGHGTGLGLPMVKRTTEEAGGSVEVESTPGRGTRVRLLLPLA